MRTENQDALIVKDLAEDAAFAVVCDGMGGANAGKVASTNAAKGIADYVERSYRAGMTAAELEKLLRNAIASANIELYDMAMNNPSYAGMGTTAVAAVAAGETAVIAHVGDSRIYLFGEELTQLTRDHSIVQTLVESGKISPEDARVHPRKNVITRAIGVEETVAVDTEQFPFRSGDRLLLCTDGLTNELDAGEITEILKNVPEDCAPDRLVDAANTHGGKDNITVVTLSRS